MGNREQRVEELRTQLGYPTKQRDPSGSRFWYLRPGEDEDEAEYTCPIAVGFYSELDEIPRREVPSFLTADEQQQEIYGHYTNRVIPDQPVMYLLLPKEEREGTVAMILPTETKLRRRQIQTFDWDSEDFQARLRRLNQAALVRTKRMRESALSVVPLVEWAFYKPITTARELAEQLARVSSKIERAIPAVYYEELSGGYLHTLLLSFQQELLPTLKLEAKTKKDYSFADIYAQTIAYGLFTARVFSYTVDEREHQEVNGLNRKEKDFNRQNAWDFLPETNPFLRQLFRDVSQQPIEHLGDELGDAISEVFSILRAAKMDAILEDFRSKMNREDIVIRFYEDFLAAYKPEMRERRGVYYTPEPVVSYMVRSVDILLKEKFNKPLGLADPEVMILDPACGTGTFLLWIFRLIHRRFKEDPAALTKGLEEESWSGYVKERLLPRIFGFELLMAPYAIAHLKLGLFLEETGYQFDSGRRLGVYLTDTLEELETKSKTLFEEFISEESNQAAKVKHDESVMIVIGNPPYSYESANNGEWISGILKDYYQVDGRRIQERNSRGLQDDYVKFIRFGQWRIRKTQKGILAFVNNHSFISNPTFRGMRQSLMEAFNNIYLVDLNGNTKRKVNYLGKYKDENVFDIQQGVSVNFFTLGKDEGSSQLWISELSGKRESGLLMHNEREDSSVEGKYGWLSKNTISTTKFNRIRPSKPFYLFSKYDDSLLDEYSKYYRINEMFNVYSVGISTSRDKLTIDFSQEEIRKRIQTFISLESEDARNIFKLGKDVRDWKISLAQEDLRNQGDALPISTIYYRPFDVRYTCFTGNTCGFHSMPRPEVMNHMFKRKGNIAICTNRQVNDEFRHAFIADGIADGNFVSLASRERTYVFPLYLSAEYLSQPKQLSLGSQANTNLTEKFVNFIQSKFREMPSLESIFYYTYSILHSSVYRTRYRDFLKTDFPRIPFTNNYSLFEHLSVLGKELAHVHLLKSEKLASPITRFEEKANRSITAGYPKYEKEKVYINKQDSGFVGVSKEVWNFHIGGYQVCHKWLKDRKGRTLSNEDILHYQRIVVAIKETIVLIQKIDEAIPSWPIE